MRRLPLLVVLVSIACTTEVAPRNPFDPATPIDQQAKARVFGAVTEGALGAVAGVTVYLKQNAQLLRSFPTDGAGAFVFDALVPGSYVVEVLAPGFERQQLPLTLSAGQEVDVGTVDLTPAAGADRAYLSGKAVLGAMVPAGDPVVADPAADNGGILIEAVGTPYAAVTTSTGDCQLAMPAGTYRLRVSHPSYVAQEVAGLEARVGAGGVAFQVILATNPAAVSGQVLAEQPDGSLAAVSNAAVTLDGTSATGFTVSDGSFTLDQLAPGSYVLRAILGGYQTASTPVLGLVGGETRLLDAPLTLTLLRGGLRGAVALADAPGDASGVVVEVSGSGRAVVTGADGAFAFDGLLAGTYELRARRDGYGAQVVGGLTVSAGATRTAPLMTLARQGGAVTIAEAPVTRALDVTLQLNAPAAAAWRASEDPAFLDPALGDTGGSHGYRGLGSLEPFRLSDRDGRHDVYVVFVDTSGGVSAPAVGSVVVDRQAPQPPTVLVNGGAPFTRSNAVGLSLTAQDLPPAGAEGAAVSGLFELELAENSGFTGSIRIPYALAAPWTLSSGDGVKAVYARAIDKAGNVSAPSLPAIVTYDTRAPESASLGVAGPATSQTGYTSTPLVTLTLAASDANAAADGTGLSVMISNTPGFVGARWQPFAPSLSWLLDPADGTKQVSVKFLDPAGNESAPISRAIELRSQGPSAPSIAVVDAGGAAVTATRLAPLLLRLQAGGTPPPVRALVADNPGLSGAVTVQLAGQVLPYTTPSPVLSLTGPDGLKTVYARFADAFGNLSELATATVTFDTTAPLPLPPSVTPAALATGGTLTLTWPAAGQEVADVGGAGVVAQTGVPAPAGGTLSVTLTAGDGPKPFVVTYRDQVGNQTVLPSRSVIRDGTPPSALDFMVTGRLADGLASTSLSAATSVTLDLSSQSDATSGLQDVLLSNDASFAGATWQPFAPSAAVPWTLAAGDGPHLVYARFRDAAGNPSAVARGGITLRQAPPTGGRLTIEGGAQATRKGLANGQLVSLAISASGAAEMLVTVDGVPGAWEPYQTLKQVSLGALDGTKVVSVLFRNDARVEGAGASAAILLDTTPPMLTSLSLLGTMGDGQTSTSYAAGPVVVASAAWDPLDGGVSAIAFTTGAPGPCVLSASARWQPVSAATTLVLTGADGTKQACAWLEDDAGNVSAPAVAAIELDTAAPPGPVFTDLGSGITSQPTVTGTLAVLPGGGSGVSTQCLGGQYAGAWTTCTPDASRRLTFALAPNQDNVLGVRTRDLARNASAATVLTITHDDVAPVPPAITGLKTTATTVAVSWSPSVSRDTVRYQVHYGTSPGDTTGVGADQGVAPVEAGAATSLQLSGLSAGTSYYLSVSAVDAAGNVSEPSGERNANPNRISPRLLSAYGAEFESLGVRADGTVRAYLAQRQGLVQLDVTDPSAPILLGRAQLPGIAPLATAPLLVLGCTFQGVAGDCVYLAGSNLEADYRSEPAAYRASVTVFFFPPCPIGGATSLGAPVASLHARAETMALSPDGLTLWAVERHQVRAYSVADPVAPVPLGDPLPLLDEAGQPVVPTRFHGAGVVPGGGGLLLGVLATPAGGAPTLYTYDVTTPAAPAARRGVALQSEVGGSLTALPYWSYYAPVPAEPVAAFFGAFHVGYVSIDRTALTGVTQVATFDPAGGRFPRAERTLVLSQGALGSNNGQTPQRLFAGPGQDRAAAVQRGDHFYLATYDPTGASPAAAEVRRFLDDGRALKQVLQADVAMIGSELRAFGVASDGVDDRLLASGGSQYSSFRVNHATVTDAGAKAAVTVHAEMHDNSFTQGGGLVFAHGVGDVIDVLDYTNPTVPVRLASYGEAGRRFWPVAVHGPTLYATEAPTGGMSSGLRIFDVGPDGALTSVGVVTTAARQVAATGTRLFVAVGNGLELWDVGDRTAPKLLTTLAVQAYAVAVRGDTVYLADANGALRIFALSGVTLTPLGNTANNVGYSVEVRGETALLDGTVVDVSNPATPVVEANVYGVYRASTMQSGYVVGQSKWGSAPSPTTSAPPPESGSRFYARGGGFDGAQPFTACGAGTSYYPTALEAAGATVFSHCNMNGLNVTTPVNPAGGELLTESLVSLAVPVFYGPPVTPLATDENHLYLGGMNGGGAIYPSFWRADTGRQAAGVLPRPTYVSTAPAIPHQLAFVDGVVLAAFAGSPASLQAFDVARPGLAWIARGSAPAGAAAQYVPALVTDREAAYAVLDQSGSSSALAAFDVRDRSAPVLAATVAGGATEKLLGLALHRRRLYAASTITSGAVTTSQVRVWRALSPAALAELTPVAVGALYPMKAVRDVAVSGRWLFFTFEGAAGHSPYGLGVALLGPGGDGAGATLVGAFESPLPLGSPTPAGDLLYARHNLGLATFDLTPLFRAGAFPTYLGSRRTSEALYTQNVGRLVVSGPFAYLLGGDKFRVFDLR